MFGFLNLNKPAGQTSRDIVNRVQKLVRPTKVGHGGTLDPLAQGVLVMALGPATRLIEYVQAQPKTYRAVFRLGQASDTEDLEGELTILLDPPQPTALQIQAVLPDFLGNIQQVPPAYSAIKVAGQRAYQLARQGQELALQPRTIRVDAIQVLSYHYPDLELEIVCGGGTYVRSLGRDIARALGTEAVMASLVRTAIGGFMLESALSPESLDAANLESAMVSPQLGMPDHPTLQLTAEELRELQNGRPLGRSEPVAEPGAAHLLAFDEQHRLQAVLKPTEKGWRIAKSFWDAHGVPPQRSETSDTDRA